jgi:hypothetical protein
VRIARESGREVVVTAQRDPAALREESTQVFGSFDAAAWERGEAGNVPKAERDEIEALMAIVEQCAVDADHGKFKSLVDFDRLLKRCEMTGNMNGWTYFDKRSWRGQMRSTAEVEAYWAQITVAGIVTPDDDPNTRIVYAFCDDVESADPTESRFWIARDGDTWKLYDWARLDLGLAESQEWGLYAKYAHTGDLQGFERWGELLSEADEAIASGELDAAKKTLRRAESESVPPEFHDFHLVLTAYRWAAVDNEEAERCYNAVQFPNDTPGAYYGLLTCKRWGNPAEALNYAKLYEEAVGPSPALLEIKAQLLTRLNRHAEAGLEWRQLLRIKPDHAYAASEYVSSLPLESKAEFESALERLGEPEKVAADIAATVGMTDYPRLLMIAEYVNRKAPETAAAQYVQGLTQFLNGRYPEAAKLYRAAFEKESDEKKRESYVNAYIEAMTADGKVLEAIKHVPDAKAAFELLYASYDESEIELTEDELRQVVAMNREMFPNDLVAMHRDASVAVTAEQWADAELVLRKALQTAGETEEDTEYYHEECESMLTTVLYRLGRWKDAYEDVGERSKQFITVARLAADERRWDVVREISAEHRKSNGDDWQIQAIEGELAAHEKRWDDAVRHLRQGLQAAADYEKWGLRYRLIDAYLKSGKWLDYFQSSSEQGETFKLLADRFVADNNWDAIEKLIGEYRRKAPGDVRIVQQEAEVAWHRDDYDAYVRLAQQLLGRDDEQIKDYERSNIEDRLNSALLRSRQFSWARKRAIAEQRDKNNSAMLAVVHAAKGELAEAQRIATDTAKEQQSAQMFYTNDDTARIFLGDEFGILHEEFPAGIPYDAANLLAVFIFDKPRRLNGDELKAAIKELSVEVAVTQPVSSKHGKSTSAVALKHQGAVVWLAAGEGEFDTRWRLGRKHDPLAETLKRGAGWLAVGTAALTESRRERIKETARRLGARLAGERAIAVHVLGPTTWEHVAFPASAELIAEWQATGRAESFEDQAVPLRTETGDSAAIDRDFERSVRAAVKAYEDSVDGELEVVWFVSPNPRVDPLRLRVEKVRRKYGSLEFDGVLVNDSLLVPELRKGLPMRFDLLSIQEARFGAEEPIRRR